MYEVFKFELPRLMGCRRVFDYFLVGCSILFGLGVQDLGLGVK